MDESGGALVVLVRTCGGVFAVSRVEGELEYVRLREGEAPCPLDQGPAIALLRED